MAGQPVAAVAGTGGGGGEALPATRSPRPAVLRKADGPGPEQPQGPQHAAEVVGDGRRGRQVGVVAADHRQKAGLGALAGRLDRVQRRVADRVGADDAHPVQHDLVGGHVEADQGHDHLPDGGGGVAGRRGDAGEDAIDRPDQAITGDVELAAALPEADQEPRRRLLAGQLADLQERLQAPQLRDLPCDELTRQG